MLIFVLIAAALAVEPTHLATVDGVLNSGTIEQLTQLSEVAEVVSMPQQTMIMCNGVTVGMQLILLRSGFRYRVEANPEILLHAETVAWQLDRLDQVAPLANSYGDGQYNAPGLGTGVNILIMDTGVNAQNTELLGRVVRPVSWKNELPCIGSHHGTWVASIAAGQHLGAAQGATIWDIKLPRGTSCTIFVCDAVMALNWILDNAPAAPFVVVMSWAAPYSPSINILCDRIRQIGGVLVAAAGNDGSNTKTCQISPASANSVLAIAATDQNDRQASFSNSGSCTFAYAGGVDILGASSTTSTGVVLYSGTSASAPLAGGVAAVLIAKEQLTTPDQVRQRLLDTALVNAVKLAGANTPNRLINLAQLQNSGGGEGIASAERRSLF
jgi:subtilisin family serine protease